MNVAAIDNLTLAPAIPGVSLAGRGGTATPFASMLDDAKAKQQPDRTREAAQELVSIALLLPLLKQARQDPFRSELFHGGQGEETFGAQLDEQLADRMSRSMSLPLTDAVYRQFGGGRHG